MIFKKLRIKNFGLFCGTHEFDLEPRARYGKARSIVLFGGKNGAGKTTFMEAIMLCLYGRNAIRSRVSVQDYHQYLAERIHRPRGGGGVQLKDAEVRLEFSYATFGELHIYTVDRTWKKNEGQVQESLTLTRDGEVLQDIGSDYAQELLKDLIPIGVSQLFFFDGEKIQSLAEEEGGTILAESVKSMLGLDIVEQSQSDLRTYATQEKRRGQTDEVEKRLDEFEKTRLALDKQLNDLRQDRAQIEARLQRAMSKIESAEEGLAADGGSYAQKREEYKSRQTSLRTQIEHLEDRIREECAGLFPFALVPQLCDEFAQQLQLESEAKKWHAVHEITGARWQELRKQLNSNVLRKSKLTSKEQKALREEIDSLLLDVFKPPGDVESVEVSHDLSHDDTQHVLDWIARGIPASRHVVQEMTHRLERAWEELRAVEIDLQRVPDDEILAPHIQKLNELYQVLGSLRTKAEHKDLEVRQVEFQLAEANRQYKKTLDDLSIQEDLTFRMQLVETVQDVLREYSSELARSKVTKLEHSVAQSFALLCRKGDVIRRIEVNPKTFAVTLYNREGRAIPKKQLSAGEKQIYAISMLWALAQTCGRPLPVIIDTPLGRLDSDHRRNLIEGYFPKASHQVIILSTDTEIDKQFFNALATSISHAYHLEYDAETESTSASVGYFWKGEDSSSESQQNQALFGSLRPA